jgi:hypothetical protein
MIHTGKLESPVQGNGWGLSGVSGQSLRFEPRTGNPKMSPSSVGKWKMRPYPLGSLGNSYFLFLDVQVPYTAPVSQNISHIYHDMASSQCSKLNPEGPKTLQPTRDSSVNFTICTSHHSTLGMYVYCSKYNKRTSVEYETTDDVLLRACASLPAFLVSLPKADILRRTAGRKFSRKYGMLATERPKYPHNISTS